MNWPLIISIPLLIALLIAMLPIFNTLTSEAFNALDAAPSLYYSNLTKILIGILPLALVLGIIIAITKINRQPPSPQYFYE